MNRRVYNFCSGLRGSFEFRRNAALHAHDVEMTKVPMTPTDAQLRTATMNTRLVEAQAWQTAIEVLDDAERAEVEDERRMYEHELGKRSIV